MFRKGKVYLSFSVTGLLMQMFSLIQTIIPSLMPIRVIPTLLYSRGKISTMQDIAILKMYSIGTKIPLIVLITQEWVGQMFPFH
jgi:hypothetical protein